MNRVSNKLGLAPRVLLVLWVAVAIFIPVSAGGEVVRVEVTSREVVSDSPDHERSGPYEVIKGIIHLEVNPDNPANQTIVDLQLAERNSGGKAEFFTDFELHKPVNPQRGNRRLLYFVNNRGNKFGSYHFNNQAGRNWLYSRGWSYLWCGWNVDVVNSDRRFNIHVPVVTDSGKTITGKIYNEICSHADDVVYSMRLVWGGSVAYPVADMDNPQATLTMRQYRWEEPVDVPPDQWSFARLEDGEVVPDPRSLYIKDGFKPGWLYDLVYVGKNPRLTGLGLAAIRDVVSFFKYESADREGVNNPLAGVVDHAYAWGHSQSARLLYHYVYQDFNGDEKGRLVLDGLIANCPGSGKGLFNSRFAQTTRHGAHLEDNLYPIDVFPFTTVEQHDPVTGERGDALARARTSGFLPKMFFVNTTSDYWTRAASLLHTDVEGKKDAGIDTNVRIYFIAGRTHIDARVGVIGRALLTALDQWVNQGLKPPDSVIPRISDGTLVSLEAYRDAFPSFPGADVPPSFYRPYRLDLGPRWRSDGIADNVPPIVGPRYVSLVPQVGADGNEIAGIKLPEIAIPLATFTGWSMYAPSFSLTLRRNRGSFFALPRTVEERKKTNDARLSVTERYPTREAYQHQVTESLLDLRCKRLLLDEDLANMLDEAARQAPFIDIMRPIDDLAVTEGAKVAFAFYEELREAKIESLYGVSLDRLEFSNNGRGYQLMSAGYIDGALELFKLNTMIAQESANVWDSLAECYLNMENYDLSRQYYEKSLELDEDNDNARIMLQRIEKELKGSESSR
jgi:hypothetical protein